MSDHPIVSCCLFTYNQASTVAEAVRSILAQTYSPMEIIIRDDCSKDETVKIICETLDAAEFKRVDENPVRLDDSEIVGRWKNEGKDVYVYRNVENLGIIKSVHGGFAAAKGEWIIPAAGDDISLPERTQCVVNRWLSSNRRATAILHQAQRIDGEGRKLGPIPQQKLDVPLGCGTNFSPRIFREFPPVTVRGGSDDWIFVRRARMLGEVVFLPDELVLYRVGSGVSTVLHDNRGPALRSQKGILRSLEQSRIDLEYIRPKISDEIYEEQLREINAAEAKATAYIELLTASSIRVRFAAFRKIHEPSMKGRILQSVYILPPSIADAILSFYLRLKNSR